MPLYPSDQTEYHYWWHKSKLLPDRMHWEALWYSSCRCIHVTYTGDGAPYGGTVYKIMDDNFQKHQRYVNQWKTEELFQSEGI